MTHSQTFSSVGADADAGAGFGMMKPGFDDQIGIYGSSTFDDQLFAHSQQLTGVPTQLSEQPPETDFDALASQMYVPPRFIFPYKNVAIDGLNYSVRDSGKPVDNEIALQLHDLNSFAISLIEHIGAAVGTHALGISDERLATIYDRLRTRYSIDRIFESDGEAGTSFVVDLGEEVHICARGDGRAVLYTVMTHELAHVASTTTEHDTEFWENYAILRAFVADMGVLCADEVPAGGGTHCRHIHVDRDEMLGIAADGSDVSDASSVSDVSDVSGVVGVSSVSDVSDRVLPIASHQLQSPTYGMTADLAPSEGDWRYEPQQKETPGLYMTEQSVPLIKSWMYSANRTVGGRYGLLATESLHGAISGAI